MQRFVVSGYCCIQYSVCSDANSFSLGTLAAAMMVVIEAAACTLDYIQLNGTIRTTERPTKEAACHILFSSPPITSDFRSQQHL